jgi:hypothetical protein
MRNRTHISRQSKEYLTWVKVLHELRVKHRLKARGVGDGDRNHFRWEVGSTMRTNVRNELVHRNTWWVKWRGGEPLCSYLGKKHENFWNFKIAISLQISKRD